MNFNLRHYVSRRGGWHGVSADHAMAQAQHRVPQFVARNTQTVLATSCDAIQLGGGGYLLEDGIMVGAINR